MPFLKRMEAPTLIDDRLFEWSGALRVVGNKAAHGVGAEVSQPDTKDAIISRTPYLTAYSRYRERFEQFKKRCQ